ncbi:WD40/YVTN/BNR-like repeat-containing protein [Alteribacter populi]|uniref:WD40/YVTN/BNR-like repeat-containing protein n=1 Tax=Alteribacter populi TaxID=2011011 RepID=UPI000BBB1149|nr:hypothetical protein [Alteribacter populi]
MNLFIASLSTIIHISGEENDWQLRELELNEGDIQSLTVDPYSGAIYAGTFDHGLHRSVDGGETFKRIGKDDLHSRVMALHVSPSKPGGKFGTLYAGTEPSELYRSIDGGRTWTSLPALLDLPSKSTWSFPPRPYTHHVRDIATGYHDPEFLLAGIELGGVMRSTDKGVSFEDRKDQSQFDCHNVILHPIDKERIYEAAGGGFAISKDQGRTWNTDNEGLGDFTYLVHVAADPGDANIVVAAGAQGPRSAYTPERAETRLFRKVGSAPWKPVQDGLPKAEGSTVFHLHTHKGEPGVFYAVNNKGVYRSRDQGKSWHRLPVKWPSYLTDRRITNVCIKEI